MKTKRLARSFRVMCLALVLTCLPLVAAWAQPAGVSRPITNIKVMASKMGGDAYVFGFALTEIVKKHSQWLRPSPVESTGSAQNTMTLALKPETRGNTIIFSQEGEVYQARAGIPPYKNAYGGLRLIATYLHSGQCFLTLNPNIKTPKDFVGKKISFYPKASASTRYMTHVIKYGYGVDPTTIRYSYGPPQQGTDALLDGLVDARIMGLTSPDWSVQPGAQAAARTRSLYFVGFTEEAVKAAREKGGYPLSTIRVPAGRSVPTQQELLIVDGSHSWYTDVSMPNETVYEIAKQIYDNVANFGSYHASGKAMTRENILPPRFFATPLHPGALEFYKQVGVLK